MERSRSAPQLFAKSACIYPGSTANDAAVIASPGHFFARYSPISLVRQGEALVQTVLDISAQKRAQVLLQQHSQELAVTNEELRTTNEELAAANEERARAKAALERLNGQLEERVVARTQELQRAHQEAQRQRQMLDTLFMKAPAPIVILEGAQLVYRLVNPAYQQIFPGRALLRRVLLHKPLVDALPELAGTAIYATLSKVYQTGETYVAQEMPLMLARHQGSPLEETYWTFTYQARHNDQGAIDGVLVFAYEVTDQVLARRRIEESARQVAASYQQLESVNQQLQKINADLDTFVYTASHDLKAPLVNIEGLLKVLQKRIGPVIGQNKSVEELLALLDSQVSGFRRMLTGSQRENYCVSGNTSGFTRSG